MTDFEMRSLAGVLAYNRVRNKGDVFYGSSSKFAYDVILLALQSGQEVP